MKVALSVTCVNDAMFPDVGKAVVRLLRRLGCEGDFPRAQTCCGQPMVNTGYLDEAVGAVRTIRTPPYPSTHNLGTNRMSDNPRDGVVNKWGQSHDNANLFVSDVSQFTTSAAENPTLTIVSLAVRQADHLAGALAKGEI